MVDSKNYWQGNGADQNTEIEDTWHWWNTFRTYTEYHSRMMVALEMSADLPSSDEILRWLGEPVDLLIIPTDIFTRNAHNYPVLSKAHKNVALKFLSKMNCKFILKASNDEYSNVIHHVQYLKYLYKENGNCADIMEG